MDLSHVLLLVVAGVAAGGVNAIAGGGSLITFPSLIAAGLPTVDANVTNSVSVFPGYVSSVVGSRADLAGRGAKGQFRQADRSGARLTVVVGEDEWSRGAAAIRDMTTGEQVEVPLDGLVPALAERIAR